MITIVQSVVVRGETCKKEEVVQQHHRLKNAYAPAILTTAKTKLLYCVG